MIAGTAAGRAEAPVRPARRPPAWALGAIISIYLLLALLLAARVPLTLAPDEDAHFLYVQHLATRGSFPVFEPLGANYPGYEFHQPPLYYLLCTPLWRATGAGVQCYMCRLESIACGALTLFALWSAVAALFPEDPALRVLATGFAALWPLHLNVTAAAGNDALAGLVSAAIFAMMARGARRPWRMIDHITVGCLIGLGLLTKDTCLVVGLAALGAAWQGSRRREGGMAPALGAVAIIAVAALAVSGWWLLRNQRLYGDPLAARAFEEAFHHSSPHPAEIMAATGNSLAGYLRALLIIMFCTTWGIFGGPNTAVALLNPFGTRIHPEALAVLPAMLICGVATVVAALGLSRWSSTWPSYDAATRCALLWWLVGLILVVLAWANFNLVHFQAQARYLHPALLPMALGFALGLRGALGQAWNGRALWLASGGFGLALIGLTLWNAFGWRTLV